MPKKQSKRVLTPIELERRAIDAVRRKFLREQKKLAKQLTPLLPGFDQLPFYPNLRGGKNDR